MPFSECTSFHRMIGVRTTQNQRKCIGCNSNCKHVHQLFVNEHIWAGVCAYISDNLAQNKTQLHYNFTFREMWPEQAALSRRTSICDSHLRFPCWLPFRLWCVCTFYLQYVRQTHEQIFRIDTDGIDIKKQSPFALSALQNGAVPIKHIKPTNRRVTNK